MKIRFVKKFCFAALLCLLCACMIAGCAVKATNTVSSESSSEEASIDETTSETSSAPQEPAKEPLKEAVMKYEIPDLYSDAYSDKFEVEEFVPMTFSKTDTSCTINYKTPENGSWTVTMVQKRWGVWMLGSMTFVDPDGKTNNIMGASTDYEWVLRCGATKGSMTFRGGNHGDYANGLYNKDDSKTANARQLDITFYDGLTGAKLTPKFGEKISVNGLRVVIHTNIYDGEYTKENVLISDEKRYLFNGTDVMMESDLNVVKNTWFYLSYSCMMPIYKRYGNCAIMYNQDGTTTTLQTPKVGTSNFGSNFSNGHDATLIDLWGEDNPACHMMVSIQNPSDQMRDGPNKLMFWDMSPDSNKIYFASFDPEPEKATLTKKGTLYEYSNKWSFEYRPDFVAPTEFDVKLGF